MEKNTKIRIGRINFIFFLVFFAVLTVSGILNKKQAYAQTGTPSNFQANPQTFTLGDQIRFSWSAVAGAVFYETRAPSLGLNGWFRAAGGTETGVVISDTGNFPTGSHQIELRACAGPGNCSGSASLTIMVKPRIEFASVTPLSVESGSPVSINWKVKGAYDFEILIADRQIVASRGTQETAVFESNYTGFSAGSDAVVIFRVRPQGLGAPYNESRQTLRITSPNTPQNPRVSIPNNIIQSVSATAQWSADYATRYKVYSDFAPMWETSLTSFTWSGDYTRTWPQNPDGPDHWVYVDACNDRGNCISSQRAYFRVYPLNYTVPITSAYSSAAPSRVNVYISKTQIIEGIDFAYLSWAADVSDEQTTYTIRASLNKIGAAGTLEMGGATSRFWSQTETALWPTGDYSLTVTACNRGRCATSSSINFSVVLPPAPTNLVLEFAPSSPYQGGYVGLNFSAKGQGINYFKIESDLPGLRHEQSWDSSRGTLWDWGGFKTWDIKTTKDWLPGRHWVSLKACGQGLQCSSIRREITIYPPPLPAGPWIFASPKSMDETGGSQYVSISWGAENPAFQYTIISDPFNNDKPRGPYGYEQDWETGEISIRTSWTSRVESPGWWPVGRHWFYNRTCNTSGCAESDVSTIMSFANRSGEPLSYDLSNPPSNPVLNIPSAIAAGSRFSASWSAGGSSREYILHSDLLPKGGVSTGGGWSGGPTVTSYEWQNTAFWPIGEHWAYLEVCNYTRCAQSAKQTFRVYPAGSPPQNARWVSIPGSVTQGNDFAVSWAADNATRYIFRSDLILNQVWDVGARTSYTWDGNITINWPPGTHWAYFEACNDIGQCVSSPRAEFAVSPPVFNAPQAPRGFSASRNPLRPNETVAFNWSPPQATNQITTFAGPGHQRSLAIGRDGYPVISAYDTAGNNMKVTKCNNADCTSNTVTSIPIKSNNGAGFNSIAIGSDGYPVITYMTYNVAGSVYELGFIKCSNASCSSNGGEIILQSGGSGEYTGGWPSIAIGRDGYPIISFARWNIVDELRFVHCTSLDCSTKDIYNTGIGPSYYSAIAIGADGMPITAHYNRGGYLVVTKCKSADCNSAIDYTTTYVDKGGSSGRMASITIAPDGLPVISYLRGTSIAVLKCGDSACSSGNAITNVATVGTFANEDYMPGTSVAVGSDGLPIIAYINFTSEDLMVTKCGNPSCSSGNVEYKLDSTNSVGYSSSIAIAPDGLPVIKFYDKTNKALRVTKCGNPSCSIVSGSAPVERYELNIPSLNINWQNLGRVFTYNFSTPHKGNHAVSLRACNSSQCSEAASLAVALLVDDPVLTTSFTSGSTLLYNQSISFTWLAYGTSCKAVVDTNPGVLLSACSGTYTALVSDFSLGTHSVYYQSCNSLGCVDSGRAGFTVVPIPANLRQVAIPASITQGDDFRIDWGADNATYYIFHSDVLGIPARVEVVGPYTVGRASTLNWSPGSHSVYYEACNEYSCVSSPTANFSVFLASPSDAPPNFRVSPTTVIKGQPLTSSWDAVSRATVYKLFLDGSLSEYVPQTSFTFSGEITNAWTLGVHRVKVSACNETGCGPESPEISFTTVSPPFNPRFISFPANITQGNNFFASWIADNAASYRLFSDLLSPDGVDVGSQTSYTWGPEFTNTYPPGTHWAYFRAYNDYGYVDSQRAEFAVFAAVPSVPQSFTASRNPIHTNEAIAFTWNQPASGSAPIDRYELNIPSLNINWQNLGRVFTYNFSTPYKGNHAVSLRACNVSQCSEAVSLAVPLLVDDPGLITSFTPGSTLLFNQSISFIWFAYGSSCKVVVDANPGVPLSSCSGTYTALASDFSLGTHSVYYQNCNSLGCVDSGRAGFTVVLPAPTNLTISPSLIRQGKDIVGSWQASAGAVRYEMKAFGLHASLNDWVDVGNITTFTLPAANTANFNTGEFSVSLRSCGLAYPNQSACSQPISVPFTVYGPYPRITVNPPVGGPTALGIDRPDPFVIYPAVPPSGEPEVVTYNFNFTVNDSPAEDFLIAASIPTNTSFDSAEPYHDQAPKRCLFQGADFIYWDYWRGRTVPMGTNEILTFRLKPQFSGLINAPQTVGVKIFVVSNYGEVYGQSNINWQAIDSQCLTVQPTKTLQEAGIELDLPSYLPEELRHPQKLFSGRTIKIPLENPLDIKKMRLDLENQTIRGGEAKTTLLPKDKTLDFLKQVGNEPTEFISDKASFEIPLNITGGTYNLKLFSENQRLKNVNINIEGLTSKDLRYSKGPDYSTAPTQTPPYVLSRAEINCGIDTLYLPGGVRGNCAWETVLGGNPDGSEMILAGFGIGNIPDIIRGFKNRWTTDDIDQMFFPNQTPPFYFWGDPQVEVFEDRFYLINLAKVGELWGLADTIGVLYKGCMTDNPLCTPEARIFKNIPQGSNPDYRLFIDRPEMVLDKKSGVIYITANTVVFDGGRIGPALYISTDLGEHFREIAIPENIILSTRLSIAPNGKLYALGNMAVSGTGEPATISYNLFEFDAYGSLNLDNVRHIRTFDYNRFGVPSISSISNRAWSVMFVPQIAIDKSSGPYRGRIYSVWPLAERVISDPNFEYYNPFTGASSRVQRRGINFDIFLSYSDNQGSTWSEPIRVNDDGGQEDQLFPSIDVDGNGIVSIAFFDHRDNRDLAQFDVYFTFSEDGGRTFSRNLRVNSRPIPNPIGGRAWGDYFYLVHGKTGEGVSYVGYPCIDDSYNGDPSTLGNHKIICIDQIDTGATVPRR